MKTNLKSAPKRALAVLLALLMLLTAAPLTAFAESNGIVQSGDFYGCVLEDGTVEVYEYYGNEKTIVIPSEMEGRIVTAVKLRGFYCSGGTVVIPENVNYIDTYNEYGIGAISVVSENPYYSSEDGVLFNKDKTEIIHYPSGKPDESYTLPDTVTVIHGDFMFAYYLKKLNLPATVTYVNSKFIAYMLSEINVDPENPNYKSIDGVLFEKTKSGLKLVKYPSRREGDSYTIPDGVTGVGDNAFRGIYKNLKLTIPASLTDITFAGFNPAEIKREENISVYGGDGGYIGIESFTVDPANPKYSSQDGVLFNKDKTELVCYPCGNMRDFYEIPNGVVYVDNFSFSDKLNGVAVPKSVKEIKDDAFSESALNYICYYGSETEWNDIKLGVNNPKVINADKFYNWNGKEFFTYNILDDGTAEITKAYASETDVVIPAEIDGYKVTAIADKAFAYNKSITSVVISNGIETIGYRAFIACTELKSVKLPNTLKSIGESAFEYCIEMTECDLPDSITNIGEDAFLTCVNLKRVSVPKGMTEIKESTFAECNNITEVIIPAGITRIDRGAFARCRSISDVYYEGYEEDWNGIRIDNTDTDWNNEYLTSANIHYNYVSSGEAIASGYCGSTTQWKLDSNGTLTIFGTGIVKNYNNASIVPWNKYAEQIKRVVVEEGVTRIGEFAFYGYNNLMSASLPNSLKEINGYVFKNCANLIEIQLPANLEKIGDSAFYGTGIKKVTIPASVKSIGYYAFSRCYKLNKIEFLGDAPMLYSNAFNKVAATAKCNNNATWTADKKQQYGGELKWIKAGLIDEGLCGSTTSWKLSEDGVLTISGTGVVKNYNSYNFVPWHKYADQINSVVVEEGVTRIGEFAFYECMYLTSVTLPESLKEINGYAFKYCERLTKINLPSNLEKIGDSAFYGTGLKKLTIPANVNYVGWYAFSRCYSLTEVEFLGSAPELPGKEFNMMTATVYYPAGDSSWNNVNWSKLGGTITHTAK